MTEPATPARRRSRRPAIWSWALGCLLAGVGAGALWRALVPVLVDPNDPERFVARDGVLAGICLLVGVLVGAALTASGPADWRRFLVVLVCSFGGAGVAWGTGLLLGIPELGAVGTPLLWPVATSATAFVASLVGGLSGSATARDVGHPAPGQLDQVRGAQLHVQPPATGAHQDGVVVEGPAVDHRGQGLALSERADPADDVPR
jgi:hypothetical protein